MRAQWDHRNADRHGRTKEESHTIKLTRLVEQVTAQYDRGPSMLAADRDIITEPIFRKAKHSPAALELIWLDRNVPIVKLSTAAATTVITKTHKKITSFFRRKRPPDLPEGTLPNPRDLSFMEAPGPVCTT